MKFKLVSMIVIALLLVTACGKKGIENPLNWQIEGFSFTDQDQKAFGLKDLKGKVWVSDFMFTSCNDVCLPMTANMAKLQKMAKEEGIKNIEFVSFSVDPTVDTPEKLKKFAEGYDADFSNWHFLTGYSQADIEQFAKKNYKDIVQKPEGANQVIHRTFFFLVDENGKIMKHYDGFKDTPFEEIIKDIKSLQ